MDYNDAVKFGLLAESIASEVVMDDVMDALKIKEFSVKPVGMLPQRREVILEQINNGEHNMTIRDAYLWGMDVIRKVDMIVYHGDCRHLVQVKGTRTRAAFSVDKLFDNRADFTHILVIEFDENEPSHAFYIDADELRKDVYEMTIHVDEVGEFIYLCKDELKKTKAVLASLAYRPDEGNE